MKREIEMDGEWEEKVLKIKKKKKSIVRRFLLAWISFKMAV